MSRLTLFQPKPVCTAYSPPDPAPAVCQHVLNEDSGTPPPLTGLIDIERSKLFKHVASVTDLDDVPSRQYPKTARIRPRWAP